MQGLRCEVPPFVRLATLEYKREENLLARFLDERTVREQGKKIPSRPLYLAYRRWVTEGGHLPMSETTFGREMKKLLGWARANVGVVYHDVALQPEELTIEAVAG